MTKILATDRPATEPLKGNNTMLITLVVVIAVIVVIAAIIILSQHKKIKALRASIS